MSAPDRTQPDPARASLPWAIVGVFDEELPSFGYTNGLADLYEHPELWMGDTEGHTPPELIWCVRDIGHWLNHLAALVRDGEPLEPGRTVQFNEEQLDLTLAFTIGEPVDKYDVEALLVEPTATVLPVTWRATWHAERPPWPLTAAGILSCPCRPQECIECQQEDRAARRTRIRPRPRRRHR